MGDEAALSAITGLTLNEIRPHMGDFETKRYTNPTMMFAALKSVGVRWRTNGKNSTHWPRYGLARIQWEGPWTAPGVPMRVRYRHSHWVGVDETIEAQTSINLHKSLAQYLSDDPHG
jgi:hypothetical protein